ncbi:MAG: L,D-transpeptidase family protein, partial [Gammaproteobacteria bacterium]|nr:L,D-transpeptidase family protein [Gammaproteobacteria bacterium]
PLGRHALILSLDGYLIHGTNKPAGVGMQVSHGCIRLYPEDIAAIFSGMPIGTPVRIVDQPMLAGWEGKDLYLQAYAMPDEEKLSETTRQVVTAALQRRAIEPDRFRIDWARAEQTRGPRRGIPVALTRNGLNLKTLLRPAVLVTTEPVEASE